MTHTMQKQIASDIAQRTAKRTRRLIQPENRLAYMHGRVDIIKRRRKREREHRLNWQMDMIEDNGTVDLI